MKYYITGGNTEERDGKIGRRNDNLTPPLKIDRDTGDVEWRTEGETKDGDGSLIFQALSTILARMRGEDIPSPSRPN